MQAPDETTRYFFVDESGDSTFFDRHGNCIVGHGGCSKHLLLGYIRTEEPSVVRRSLAELRAHLGADSYFQGIPSFTKTLRAFHAKDDSPEVRREVYQLLGTLPLKAQFIFARKKLKTFRQSFKSKEGAFYDHLVGHLFKRSMHLARQNRICFAKRGSRARQAPLTRAVEDAGEMFRNQFPEADATRVKVECQSPIGEPCLQAVDYFLWAVQRLFVRQEARFFEAIESQVEFVWDLYDTASYPRNIYTSKNRLTVDKISPL